MTDGKELGNLLSISLGQPLGKVKGPPDGTTIVVTLGLLLAWSLKEPEGEAVRVSDGAADGWQPCC